MYIRLFMIALALVGQAQASEETLANKGIDLYDKACVQCHSATRAAAIGAPAAHDVKQWQQRFEQAKQQLMKKPGRFSDEMAYLIHQIKIGKGLMAHGGLCVESGVKPEHCDDEAYRVAIEYMASKLVIVNSDS